LNCAAGWLPPIRPFLIERSWLGLIMPYRFAPMIFLSDYFLHLLTIDNSYYQELKAYFKFYIILKKQAADETDPEGYASLFLTV
jgi:hypothetical protein